MFEFILLTPTEDVDRMSMFEIILLYPPHLVVFPPHVSHIHVSSFLPVVLKSYPMGHHVPVSAVKVDNLFLLVISLCLAQCLAGRTHLKRLKLGIPIHSPRFSV